jgi:hypothetical protein
VVCRTDRKFAASSAYTQKHTPWQPHFFPTIVYHVAFEVFLAIFKLHAKINLAVEQSTNGRRIEQTAETSGGRKT